MTEFDPGRCANCPRILDLMKFMEHTDEFVGGLALHAMDPKVDQVLAPIMFNMLNHETFGSIEGPNGEEIGSPAELAAVLRKQVGEFTNYVESQTAENLTEAKTLVKNCQGALKMRAAKAGRQITATVCNSPSLPNTGTTENAHIARKPTV